MSAWTGLTEFQVSVGQVDYYKAIFAQTGLSQEEEEELRELISQKNYFGVEELVKNKNMDKSLARVLSQLPQMFGSTEVLEKAKSLTDNPQALKAVARLEEIYELLKVYGYEKYVTFDFAMLSKYHYYTGIIFQAYTYGTGEALIKGGRYNQLMKHFGKPAASIGFAIVVDNLLMALSRQKNLNGGRGGRYGYHLPQRKPYPGNPEGQRASRPGQKCSPSPRESN